MESKLTERDLIDRGLGEEYYPISQEILASFPKYRPAIDLYAFREDIAQLYPYCVKNQRITNEQVNEIAKLCKRDCLFVSRADHHIYVEHLAHQCDFVLVDPNLHDTEIQKILVKALTMRLEALIEQPLPIVFEPLRADVLVFVEYILRDRNHIDLFMEELFTGEYTLVEHSLNVLFIGVWLYLHTEQKYSKKVLGNIATGLILHDIGCSKVPGFIVNKKAPLTKDEMDKFVHHPRLGLALANKFGCLTTVVSDIIFQHHERQDGTGYPHHINGTTLSLPGMLAGVADTFATMIVKKNNPRLTTLKAAQAMVKDHRFAPRYTEPLFASYIRGDYPNV